MPASASGVSIAAAVAAASSRPMRSRSARLQNEAFIAPRCAGRSGVPASTSRNGRAAPTSCAALSNVRPTAGSSVCASSSSRTSGFLRTRLRMASASRAGRSSPRSRPNPGTEKRRGSGNCIHHGRTACRSRGAVGTSAGARRTTSRPACASASCCSQTSSAVFPLPRGPWSTTSLGGATPRRRSSRSARNSACSVARPARYGGSRPGPGRNGPRPLVGSILAV